MQVSVIVAARMLANKSVSKAPLDCCTGLNLLKGVPSENGPYRTLGHGGGRNPPVESWYGDAEVACHIARRYSACEQLLGRFDLAVGHLSFPATFAAELPGNVKTGAGSLDGEFAFHLGQAGHHMKEEAS
jgi:hypothetical protein